MIDDDCDGKTDCTDEDCDGTPPCPPAKKDPTQIRFGREGALDLIRGHATLDLPDTDLTTVDVGLLLTNAHGVIYRDVLPAGSLVPNSTGKVLRFKNPDAREHGGIYLLKMKRRAEGSPYSISFDAYGELSAATEPHMRLQYYIAGQPLPFITSNEPWRPTPHGWRAPMDH